LNLDARRFDPTVLIYCDIQQLRSELDNARIPVQLVEKKAKLDLVFLINLIKFLRKTKPDVLHSYLNAPNFWARVAGRLAGIKFIVTSERTGNIETFLTWSMLEKVLNHVSSFIVANSESGRCALVEKIGVRPEKVRVIYNGVDVAKFAAPKDEELARWRSFFQLQADDFIVTLPGRLARQKNQLGLVRAVSGLGAYNDKMKVLFAGNEFNAPLKEQVVAEVEARGLKDRFIFAGVQENMAAVYGLSTVVVLPSLWEGFPNAILEAMAAGKPVIASDVADNRKIIEHGVTGYLFKSNSESGLRDCLADVVSKDRTELARMGSAGQAYVRAQYSIEKMVKSYEQIYASA
jgi:glycosyltransferase involved in cell wall biosynthesis